MKNTTKGAFAASAAAVLLLGGAGSLAYWSDAETIKGGDVTAGSLSLDAPTCDASWKYAAGKAGAGNTVARFVPGDVITKNCTFTVRGSGDNLTANLATPATYAVTGTNVTATVTAAYKLGTATMANPAVVTAADNGKVVTAAITVTFPYGTDENAATKTNTNTMQGSVATLDDIAVTLTQANPNQS
ncbi:alternate-type signal peptide domain-containing protein [Nocardioides terrigena]|uniref:alternate-type signal peptide domain-containing protein n=1 Tax=Nocardioides terrigena TaxID=424797 RepID=UPI000D30523D|nr:alternate-type signal peptide domain-containing protein [Nocardioides terrigena]